MREGPGIIAPESDIPVEIQVAAAVQKIPDLMQDRDGLGDKIAAP